VANRKGCKPPRLEGLKRPDLFGIILIQDFSIGLPIGNRKFDSGPLNSQSLPKESEEYMPFSKGGNPISCLADWGRLAGPKSSDQWVPDRSAMEVARAWLHDGGKSLPAEVTRIIEDHPDFETTIDWYGEPEAKLPFDAFAGEPRNTDILVMARDKRGAYVLAVEGKADEPFGASVADTLSDAVERRIGNPRSKGVDRVVNLGIAILGTPLRGEPKIGELRYQLLTATAGAVCEAERRGVDRAVLFIHEFVTRKTSDNKHRLNANDLDRFLHRLSHGSVREAGTGLLGPFEIPGAPLLSTAVRLYVGKLTQNLR